jgi:hypothetical protein
VVAPNLTLFLPFLSLVGQVNDEAVPFDMAVHTRLSRFCSLTT